MEKRMFWIIVFCLVMLRSAAQEVSSPKNRFEFAQTTIGLKLSMSNGGNTFFNHSDGNIERYNFQFQGYPSIHFGGLHFWNSIELYFALPLGQLLKKEINDEYQFHLNLSEVFGIKYFPLKLNPNTLRPYIGISISGINYQQKSSDTNRSGALVTRLVYPLHAGISWRRSKFVFDFNIMYNVSNQFEYYISRKDEVTVSTPELYWGLSTKILLDGTKSNEKYYYTKEEEDYQYFKHKNVLNSWFIGIGPSTSFYLKELTYNTVNLPFLHNPSSSHLFLDFSLGYYHEKSNAFIDFAYREITFELEAFGYTEQLKRVSRTIEINKFLLDYQGFVPFIGIGINMDRLIFNLQENSVEDINSSKNSWSPSFVVGWDILPTRLEYMTLRTNIRYAPSINLELENKLIAFDQLELNLIQLVFYPQRFRNLRRR